VTSSSSSIAFIKAFKQKNKSQVDATKPPKKSQEYNIKKHRALIKVHKPEFRDCSHQYLYKNQRLISKRFTIKGKNDAWLSSNQFHVRQSFEILKVLLAF
jgi:hypothetical protein